MNNTNHSRTFSSKNFVIKSNVSTPSKRRGNLDIGKSLKLSTKQHKLSKNSSFSRIRKSNKILKKASFSDNNSTINKTTKGPAFIQGLVSPMNKVNTRKSYTFQSKN